MSTAALENLRDQYAASAAAALPVGTLQAIATALAAPGNALSDAIAAKADESDVVAIRGGVDAPGDTLKKLLDLFLSAQPGDATLSALANLAVAADTLIVGAGPDSFATTPLSAFVRTLLPAADEAAIRGLLSLGALALKSTIANADITPGTIANDRLASVSAGTVAARLSNGLGPLENVTLAALKSALAIASGDVSGLQGLLDAKQASLGFTPENVANRGVAGGYAPIGPDGKVPVALLPANGSFKGTYDASTNTPSITSGSGTFGDFYVVQVGGTVAANGIGAVNPGDQIFRDTAIWKRIVASNAVASVAGRTGVIDLVAADIGNSTATGRSILTGDQAAGRLALALGALAVLNAVGTGQITDKAVTLAKQADMASASLVGRTSAGAGPPEILSRAQVLSYLALAASNIGDFASAVDARTAGKADANALNASSLNTGTVPDARLSGTYTDVGLKRTSARPNVLKTSLASTTNGVTRDLVSYANNNATVTGAIVFLAPADLTGVMHRLHVSAYNWTEATNNLDLVVTGYRSGAAAEWTKKGLSQFGTNRPSVRLARKTTRNPDGSVATQRSAFIVGDVDTVWNYPHLVVELGAFNFVVPDAYLSGWTSELVTSLDEPAAGGTGYDLKTDALVDKGLAAYAPVAHVGSGGSAHALATTAVAGFMSAGDKVKLDGLADAYSEAETDAAIAAAGKARNPSILDYGGDGAGGSADAAATIALIEAQKAALPRLLPWCAGAIKVGQLLGGSDLIDRMPQVQKFFRAMQGDTGLQIDLARGKAFEFEADVAWLFKTRPSSNLGPQGQYIELPQVCTLEWKRAWEFTTGLAAGSSFPTTNAKAPVFLGRAGRYGPPVPVNASVERGADTIVVASAQAALLANSPRGARWMLRNSAKLADLDRYGVFTLQDGYVAPNWSPAPASVTDDNYKVGDVVKYVLPQGTQATALIYICTTEHRSLASDGSSTGLTSSKWAAYTFPTTELWTAGATYARGAHVNAFDGFTYRANLGHTATSDFPADVTNGRWRKTGFAARAEIVLLDRVDTQTNTVYLLDATRDYYDSAAKPILTACLEEPTIRLVNPLAIGAGYRLTTTQPTAPGAAPTYTQDRFLEIDLGHNVRIEGGHIQDFGTMIVSSVGGGIDGLTYDCTDNDAAPGGGLCIADCTQDFTISNVTTNRGAQPLMFSGTFRYYGITRNVLCWRVTCNRPSAGISMHNTHAEVTFDTCGINGNTSSIGYAFDIRSPGTRLLSCWVARCAGGAVLLRRGCINSEIRGFRADGAVSGIVLDTTALSTGDPYLETTPRGYTITDNLLTNIGGVGTKGGIRLTYAMDTAYPLLEELELARNTVITKRVRDGDDNWVPRPFDVGGRWNAAILKDNTAKSHALDDASLPKPASLVIGDGGAGGTANGPKDLQLTGHRWASTFTAPSIASTTGVTNQSDNAQIGA